MDGLKEWVKNRAEGIISAKEEAGIVPAVATELEIIEGIRVSVLECMRSLYKEGAFKGTNTINHPALMRKI